MNAPIRSAGEYGLHLGLIQRTGLISNLLYRHSFGRQSPNQSELLAGWRLWPCLDHSEVIVVISPTLGDQRVKQAGTPDDLQSGSTLRADGLGNWLPPNLHKLNGGFAPESKVSGRRIGSGKLWKSPAESLHGDA